MSIWLQPPLLSYQRQIYLIYVASWEQPLPYSLPLNHAWAAFQSMLFGTDRNHTSVSASRAAVETHAEQYPSQSVSPVLFTG